MRDIAATHVIPGSDLHYATLYSPSNLRTRLILLGALKSEVDAIPLTVSDRGVARVKLDWWRLEADRLEQGMPRHQLTQAYNEHSPGDEELCDSVKALVSGLDDELQGQDRETKKDQWAWFELTYGPIYKVQSRVQTSIETDIHADAVQLGLAIEWAYSLLNLKFLALRGIKRLPKESINAAGCSWDEIQGHVKSDGVVRLLESETKFVTDKIVALHNDADRTTRQQNLAVYTLSTIVVQAMQEMKTDGYRIWKHRIELTPIRKLWLAWRTRFI